MIVTNIMSKKVPESCRRDLNEPQDKTAWKLQLLCLTIGQLLSREIHYSL